MHRAKIAHKRVRMEGWRQRRLGSKTRNLQGGRRKTDLTLTGLLMEGLTPMLWCGYQIVQGIFHQIQSHPEFGIMLSVRIPSLFQLNKAALLALSTLISTVAASQTDSQPRVFLDPQSVFSAYLPMA